MSSPEAELPETDARRCPACQGEEIASMGPVEVAGGLIKAKQRCDACGTRFIFVRKPIL